MYIQFIFVVGVVLILLRFAHSRKPYRIRKYDIVYGLAPSTPCIYQLVDIVDVTRLSKRGVAAIWRAFPAGHSVDQHDHGRDHIQI